MGQILNNPLINRVEIQINLKILWMLDNRCSKEARVTILESNRCRETSRLLRDLTNHLWLQTIMVLKREDSFLRLTTIMESVEILRFLYRWELAMALPLCDNLKIKIKCLIHKSSIAEEEKQTMDINVDKINTKNYKFKHMANKSLRTCHLI